MDVVEEIFHRILTPLYGPQTKAIQQIREGVDRSCYLLYEGDNPTGVLVFKTVLSNEFEAYGVRESIEVKSLFVDHAQQNSGRGVGSALVDKLKEEVTRLGLNHKGIHVTVSETKQESLAFFIKKGFGIAHAWKDRYVAGVTEYLLSCPAEAPHSAATFDVDRISTDPPELLHVIHNAHLDDIHSLVKLSDGTFVSGSKDNSMYKWDQDGKLVKVVKEVEPTHQSERDWITAVEVINRAYWVSGLRNGKMELWKTNGEFVKEINVKLPGRNAHFSHEFNTRRINCIAAGLDPDVPNIFVGFPTMFDDYNMIEGRTEHTVTTHHNDWVYCIHPLTHDSLLTVTGCTIDLWNRSDLGWSRSGTVMGEGRGKRVPIGVGGKTRYQRPFVSSLTSMMGSPNLASLSLFDGSVQVLDISTSQIVHRWDEHKGRVWKTEAIDGHRFASSGEDRTIKIWELRAPKSTHTIKDHVGQVTAMLLLNEETLIAGSCPERAMTLGLGAQIRFYDTRKF